MGFCSRWIGLIMECIRTISYSILVNGEPKGLINPTRGIRQGDPLSPFLFLLCTKGLHNLITKAVRAKEINSFSLCKRSLKLTHLFSPDDNLLFCKANPKNVEMCSKYYLILNLYRAKKSIEKRHLFSLASPRMMILGRR